MNIDTQVTRPFTCLRRCKWCVGAFAARRSSDRSSGRGRCKGSKASALRSRSASGRLVIKEVSSTYALGKRKCAAVRVRNRGTSPALPSASAG